MAMGWVKLGRFGKARCVSMDTAVLGALPARQVVFEGRASRPEPEGAGAGVGVGAGAGTGVGAGAGAGAGGPGMELAPPPQPDR
jgi:hypothetical protein